MVSPRGCQCPQGLCQRCQEECQFPKGCARSPAGCRCPRGELCCCGVPSARTRVRSSVPVSPWLCRVPWGCWCPWEGVGVPGVCCCHQSTYQGAQQCASVPRVVPGPGPGWLGAIGTAQCSGGTESPSGGPRCYQGARGAIGDRQPGGPACAPGRLEWGQWGCGGASQPRCWCSNSAAAVKVTVTPGGPGLVQVGEGRRTGVSRHGRACRCACL